MITLGFTTARTFLPDEREFAMTHGLELVRQIASGVKLDRTAAGTSVSFISRAHRVRRCRVGTGGGGYPDSMSDNSDHHPVPGAGPGAEPATPDGQRALGLDAGIAVVATVLSVFVTVVFAVLGQAVLTVVFAVVAVLSIAALVWAIRVRRKAAP